VERDDAAVPKLGAAISQRRDEDVTMRTVRTFVAVLVSIILSAAANAAEYQYLNSRTNPRWPSDLVAFLQKNKPTPDNISIAITPAGDVHAYVVPGQFTGTFSVERLLRHPVDRPNALLRAIIDGGTGKMIGFTPSAGSAPSPGQFQPPPLPGGDGGTFDVYILTFTKPGT
jgi:hypothetical protein